MPARVGIEWEMLHAVAHVTPVGLRLTQACCSEAGLARGRVHPGTMIDKTVPFTRALTCIAAPRTPDTTHHEPPTRVDIAPVDVYFETYISLDD